jgi:hypothetical protein
LFRLLTGFDDGLDVISREKIDARLLQWSILAATDLSSARLRPTFLIVNLASDATGVTGLVGWLNMEKNLSPSAIVLWD